MQSPDPGPLGTVVTPLRPRVQRPYEKRLTDDAIDRLLDVILADLRAAAPRHDCLLCLNRPSRKGSEPQRW